MPLPNRPSAYSDIHSLLTLAVREAGGRVRCDTPGKATYWRMRAHKYIALCDGQYTHFERFLFTIEDCDVLITLRAMDVTFIAADGTEHLVDEDPPAKLTAPSIAEGAPSGPLDPEGEADDLLTTALGLRKASPTVKE